MTDDSSAMPDWDPRKEQNLSGKPLVRWEPPADDGVAPAMARRQIASKAARQKRIIVPPVMLFSPMLS